MTNPKDCLKLMKEMGESFHTKDEMKALFENAYYNSFINGVILSEDKVDNAESQKVKEMILSNKYWICNDYEAFLDSLSHSTRAPFLSKYTAEQFAEDNVQTYQLKGYYIGYALKYDKEDGYTDIISVHNNEPNIAHIGDALIESAKTNGGNKLDHYDGFLSNLYQKHGFTEYERYPWDDKYADPKWDYKTYGRPDVVLRRLQKNDAENQN